MPTSPTPIDALPPTPNPDDAAGFDSAAYTWSNALPTFRTQTNDAATNVYNNAVEAEASATTAATSEANTATSANKAEAAQTAALATANASMWVAGTNYALGANVISPIDFFTYRRKVAGAGVTDPSADTANWMQLTSSAAQIQSSALIVSAAGGTADAITATYSPAITALANGMALYVRAASANTTTTPTFTPNNGTIAAKTIVKGNGLPLVAGDIAGAGHWIELQYDAALDKWVLLNPATGTAVPGRLLNVQIFTASGTYTPTVGTKSIIVEVQAGGGGGGGSSATGAGQLSGGVGGNSGAYGKSRITAGFAGAAITIGSGGAGGAVGGAGGNGGTSSFGAFVSAPGGAGGNSIAPSTPPVIGALSFNSAIASGGSISNNSSGYGGPPFLMSVVSALSGSGSASLFGSGPVGTALPGVGSAAINYGCGGSGALTGASGAGYVGGAGAPGVVIVWEYA